MGPERKQEVGSELTTLLSSSSRNRLTDVWDHAAGARISSHMVIAGVKNNTECTFDMSEAIIYSLAPHGSCILLGLLSAQRRYLGNVET